MSSWLSVFFHCCFLRCCQLVGIIVEWCLMALYSFVVFSYLLGCVCPPAFRFFFLFSTLFLFYFMCIFLINCLFLDLGFMEASWNKHSALTVVLELTDHWRRESGTTYLVGLSNQSLIASIHMGPYLTVASEGQPHLVQCVLEAGVSVLSSVSMRELEREKRGTKKEWKEIRCERSEKK